MIEDEEHRAHAENAKLDALWHIGSWPQEKHDLAFHARDALLKQPGELDLDLVSAYMDVSLTPIDVTLRAEAFVLIRVQASTRIIGQQENARGGTKRATVSQSVGHRADVYLFPRSKLRE